MKATAKTVRSHNEFIQPQSRPATVVRGNVQVPAPSKLNVPAIKEAILQAIREVLEKQASELPRAMPLHRKRARKQDLYLPDENTITGRLWRMYDEAGRDLTVSGARELASHAGLNKTSAEISFYNWRKNRAQQHGA